MFDSFAPIQLEEKQKQMQKNIEERQRRGESFAHMKEIWAFAQREQQEAA